MMIRPTLSIKSDTFFCLSLCKLKRRFQPVMSFKLYALLLTLAIVLALLAYIFVLRKPLPLLFCTASSGLSPTIIGGYGKGSCPSGFIGQTKALCLADGTFGAIDTADCRRVVTASGGGSGSVAVLGSGSGAAAPV